MSPAVYKFDHGLSKPVATAVYNGVVAAVADLTLGPAPNSETDYGPFLAEVRRLPLSMSALYSIADSQWLSDYMPRSGPAMAVCVKSAEVSNNASNMITASHDVEICVSSSARSRPISGAIEQDPQQSNRMHDPGLDVAVEMVMSRLFHGIELEPGSPGPKTTASIVVTGWQMVGSVNDQLWVAISATVDYSYRLIDGRYTTIIDAAFANHDVQSGGIIATQGVIYP